MGGPDMTEPKVRVREGLGGSQRWKTVHWGAVPAFTRRAFVRSTSSGNQFRASPTKTAVDRAMQRWPAAPNAAPTSWFRVFSLFASGITTPWFLAPCSKQEVVSVLFCDPGCACLFKAMSLSNRESHNWKCFRNSSENWKTQTKVIK